MEPSTWASAPSCSQSSNADQMSSSRQTEQYLSSSSVSLRTSSLSAPVKLFRTVSFMFLCQAVSGGHKINWPSQTATDVAGLARLGRLGDYLLRGAREVDTGTGTNVVTSGVNSAETCRDTVVGGSVITSPVLGVGWIQNAKRMNDAIARARNAVKTSADGQDIFTNIVC